MQLEPVPSSCHQALLRRVWFSFFSPLLSDASTTLLWSQLSLPFTRLTPSSSSNQLARHQTCSSMPMSVLDWWAQRRAQHSSCVTPVRGKNDLHQHADSTPHNPVQTAADLLCYKGTVTAFSQFVIHGDWEVFIYQAAFQSVSNLSWCALPHRCKIPNFPLLTPQDLACQGPSGFTAQPSWAITPCNFILCRVAEGVYCPSINGNVEQTTLQLDHELLITTFWAQKFSQFLMRFFLHLSSLSFINLSVRKLGQTGVQSC